MPIGESDPSVDKRTWRGWVISDASMNVDNPSAGARIRSEDSPRAALDVVSGVVTKIAVGLVLVMNQGPENEDPGD